MASIKEINNSVVPNAAIYTSVSIILQPFMMNTNNSQVPGITVFIPLSDKLVQLSYKVPKVCDYINFQIFTLL